MKKIICKEMFLPILLCILLTSCSKECGYRTERVNELLEEIEQLEEERDNAPTESISETYQGKIDRKQEQLNEEMGKCE